MPPLKVARLVTPKVEDKVVAPVTPNMPPREVAPVPTVKVFVPVTEVLPLRETVPVPVEKVVAPVCEILPASVRLPFSRTVNLDVPPDWISSAVLVAPLVSLMIKDGAVPA